MFWKKKNQIVDKGFKCEKCKCYLMDFQHYCDTCFAIYLRIYNGIEYPYLDYVWFHGIKENGLDWYLVARDKIFEIIKKDKIKQEKQQERRLKKSKEQTEKWLKFGGKNDK